MRSVFGRVLQSRRRALSWWCVAAGALAIWILAFYPVISDNPELAQLFAEMPPELLALFAGGVVDLVSPVGYLESQLFATMVPLVLLIYAIGFGTQEVAGEEERGTIEMVLSTPVARSRFLLEKFSAMVVCTALLGAAFWLVLALGDGPFGLDVGAGNLAAGTAGGVLLALAYGSLALAIGGVTGRRALASGVSAGLAVLGYLLYTMAPLTEVLEPYHSLSPFYYYLAAEPLQHGLDLAHSAGLSTAILIFVALAVTGFRRRDLAI